MMRGWECFTVMGTRTPPRCFAKAFSDVIANSQQQHVPVSSHRRQHLHILLLLGEEPWLDASVWVPLISREVANFPGGWFLTDVTVLFFGSSRRDASPRTGSK